MSAFEEKHVRAALARIPHLSSIELRDLRSRAAKAGLESLASACDDELSMRPKEWSAEEAVAFESMAEQVRGLTLAEAIRYAFTVVRPCDSDEVRCLRWIAANPGCSFQAALRDFGKGDLSLVIGHLVYNRYGCFKHFFQVGEDQSSVLIHKDRSAGGVCYTLRKEALEIFREINVIP